jgi:hypothetical protein
MLIDRKLVDDYLESYFSQLGGNREKYARQYWLSLTGRGNAPDPDTYDLPAGTAQQIRIRLAQSI